MSKGERNRIKTRVRTAMARPGRDRRPLPRRPPALRLPARRRRPAPQPGQGRAGKRLHQLEPDPTTAPIVRASSTSSSQAPASRDRPQVSPRRHPIAVRADDPARNRHRPRARHGPSPPCGRSWPTRATPAIEVWNNSSATRVLIDVDDVAARPRDRHALERPRRLDLVHRAHPPSARHPRATSTPPEQISLNRRRPGRAHLDPRSPAVPVCAAWSTAASAVDAWRASRNHGRPTTAASSTDEYPVDRDAHHPQRLRPRRRRSSPDSTTGSPSCSTPSTSTRPARHSPLATEPDPDEQRERRRCDDRRSPTATPRSRTTGRCSTTEPTPRHAAGEWIAEATANAARLERQLGDSAAPPTAHQRPTSRPSSTALRDIAGVLNEPIRATRPSSTPNSASPLTYHPDATVTVAARPRGVTMRVGGGT